MARRPGRPRLDPNGHTVEVGLTLPTRQFDTLCHEAVRHGVSLPEMIRRRLAQANRHRRADDDAGTK